MIEPPNHTAFHDNAAYTWVRVDEYPDPTGATWFALTDDPRWDESARESGPVVFDWNSVSRRDLSMASAAETARSVHHAQELMAHLVTRWGSLENAWHHVKARQALHRAEYGLS